MPRALLIYNPAAARTDPEVLRVVGRVFTREGWELDVVGTTRLGDAGRLARAGVLDGAELVAVYGGDGTAIQAVSGVVGCGVPVALIPGGTGNVLAGNLRLPREPEAAALVAVRGRRKAIDLGRVERTDGTHYFAVACGTGLDAQLMAATTEDAKRRWGVGAYVARAAEILYALAGGAAHTITVDGQSHDVEAVMVVVANCREYVPPFFALHPGIAPDDGVLDVVAVNARSALEGLNVAWRLFTGRAKPGAALWFGRGRTVRIATAEPRPVELDGEVNGTTPVAAEVMPGAIEVVVEM